MTPPTCSRAGCAQVATTTVNWRNPRIHSPERVKVWHACDDHAGYLRDYLAARDFPVVVAPLGTAVESVPSVASASTEASASTVPSAAAPAAR
jgi:hypothetical protein